MVKVDGFDNLAEEIIILLKENGYTLTTAESCTGGMLSSKIVDVEGASSVFNEGHITYSNAAKVKYLNVSQDTLNVYGAVSRQTAEEMAAGAAKLAGAEVSLSVTGLAGTSCPTAYPTSDDFTIPDGTVYIGCYLDGKVVVEHHMIKGSRNEVRLIAVQKALRLLYDCLILHHQKKFKQI